MNIHQAPRGSGFRSARFRPRPGKSHIDVRGEVLVRPGPGSGRRTTRLAGALAAAIAAGTAAFAGGATFTVTNTDDTGAGSLRQAILDANANPGADTIDFNIPGAGVHVIAPTTVLPALTETVTIDGYTQPGASPNTDPVATNAVILIELDGSSAPPGTGIQFVSHDGSLLRGLAIHGFGAGVQINGGLSGCTVRGTFVGTDASGAVALGNNEGINASTPGSVLGGPSPADRNLISGNTVGITAGSNGGVIQGNLIGTDKTGSVALGNTSTGITCVNGSGAGMLIGGAGPGEGNVISGNALGVFMEQAQTVDVVYGNLIGVNAAGTGPLGNGVGVLTNFGGDGAVIGGIGPGQANVIAYNLAQGVLLTSNGGSKNSVRGNSIHDNGELGIDLGVVGPDFNDPLDADNGANQQQNFPILTSVEHLGPQGGSTRILGKLNSTPSTTFDLDFYANASCSNFPREFLEGETYLGSSQVTTDASGDAAIDVTLSVVTDPAARISATATDPNGNTSEFSQRIIFSISPTSGDSAGGTPITVHGTDFADPATLTFGGAPATVTFTDDHTLATASPALSPGTVNDVVVTTPDGTAGTLVKGWVADFLDVPEAQQFHAFVTTLVSNGITVGVGGGNYGVDQPTLRQQMAVFLLKARHGLCYTPPACSGTFTDVACPSTFADWIEALAAEGITGGCGGSNYCPTSPVRRDQMAVFLLKAEHGSNYAPPQCAGVFSDVACPSAFADWIERLAAEGITGGCGNGNYCPLSNNTRGQMAVFITKTFSLQ